MKIPYNILIQIKMSVRPYFKGFTLIFFFYNCRKQDYTVFPLRKCDISVKFLMYSFACDHREYGILRTVEKG